MVFSNSALIPVVKADIEYKYNNTIQIQDKSQCKCVKLPQFHIE